MTFPSSHERSGGLHDERGAAMVITLMAMALMLALGVSLVLTAMTETELAAGYGQGAETLSAAEAAVERVLPDMLIVPDWSTIPDGAMLSSFVDGAPAGQRALPDGSGIDLTEATNRVRCNKPAVCGAGDMDAATEERPWGANNPRWRLYGFGPIRDLLPSGAIDARPYVIVWVADDPSENDDNPLVDGGPPAPGIAAADNPGRGIVALLACAYGPGGARRCVTVSVTRVVLGDAAEVNRGGGGQPAVRMLSWGEQK